MYVDWMGNSSSGLPEDNQEISSKKGGGKKKGNGKRKNTEKVDPKSAKKAKLETAKYVYDKLFVEVRTFKKAANNWSICSGSRFGYLH